MRRVLLLTGFLSAPFAAIAQPATTYLCETHETVPRTHWGVTCENQFFGHVTRLDQLGGATNRSIFWSGILYRSSPPHVAFPVAIKPTGEIAPPKHIRCEIKTGEINHLCRPD